MPGGGQKWWWTTIRMSTIVAFAQRGTRCLTIRNIPARRSTDQPMPGARSPPTRDSRPAALAVRAFAQRAALIEFWNFPVTAQIRGILERVPCEIGLFCSGAGHQGVTKLPNCGAVNRVSRACSETQIAPRLSRRTRAADCLANREELIQRSARSRIYWSANSASCRSFARRIVTNAK